MWNSKDTWNSTLACGFSSEELLSMRGFAIASRNLKRNSNERCWCCT